jgi:hypothetical protein
MDFFGNIEELPPRPSRPSAAAAPAPTAPTYTYIPPAPTTPKQPRRRLAFVPVDPEASESPKPKPRAKKTAPPAPPSDDEGSPSQTPELPPPKPKPKPRAKKTAPPAPPSDDEGSPSQTPELPPPKPKPKPRAKKTAPPAPPSDDEGSPSQTPEFPSPKPKPRAKKTAPTPPSDDEGSPSQQTPSPKPRDRKTAARNPYSPVYPHALETPSDGEDSPSQPGVSDDLQNFEEGDAGDYVEQTPGFAEDLPPAVIPRPVVIQEEERIPTRTVKRIPPPPRPMTYPQFVSSLPVPSIILTSNKDANAERWVREFQNYIYSLLAMVYESDVARREAVNEENLIIWIRAFTDPTFDADNFETMETIGDSVLDYAFMKYLYKSFALEGVTPQVLTNLRSYYMSGEYQGSLAEEIKLTHWIRLGAVSTPAELESAITSKIRGNIFETFFAALDAVSDNVRESFKLSNATTEALNAPCGPNAARRICGAIFDHHGIDLKRGRDPAKTILNQLGDLFGKRQIGIRATFPLGSPSGPYTVTLNTSIKEELQKAGIDVSTLPEILSYGHNNDTEATEEAYSKLAAVGVSPEWINETRSKISIENLEPASLKDAIVEKAKRLGYPKLLFEFPISSKHDTGEQVATLYGIDRRDQRFLLGTGRGLSGVAKRKAAHSFLSGF